MACDVCGPDITAPFGSCDDCGGKPAVEPLFGMDPTASPGALPLAPDRPWVPAAAKASAPTGMGRAEVADAEAAAGTPTTGCGVLSGTDCEVAGLDIIRSMSPGSTGCEAAGCLATADVLVVVVAAVEDAVLDGGWDLEGASVAWSRWRSAQDRGMTGSRGRHKQVSGQGRSEVRPANVAVGAAARPGPPEELSLLRSRLGPCFSCSNWPQIASRSLYFRGTGYV